jgi:pimeloyl-ACP methyl ester carboxylesterase
MPNQNTIWVDLLSCQIRYLGTKYRTRVIEAGEGEPLILLHGGGGHAEAYSRNLIRLGRNFRAMAIDMVWHGLSSKPPFMGEAVPVYADQVIDLLDTMGIASAHIEGEAIGGRVAMRLAIHYPERVKKLILNNTGGVRFRTSEPRPESSNQYQTAASAAIDNPTRETVRKRLERLMVTPDRVTDELVEIRYRFYSDPKTQEAQANLRSSGHEEIDEDEVTKIRCPTLVLATPYNPLRGMDAGKRLAALIPGARFHLIEDAAIWMQWEQAEEHDRVVSEFLNDHRREP